MIKRQLALQASATEENVPKSTATTVAKFTGKKKKDTKTEGEVSVPSAFSSPRPSYTNKQRVLIIASRGINARYRHLLEDLKKLIPHHKKDNKLDTKGNIHAVNEIAEVNSCNQILYLECRKRQDLYMHLSRTPQGPSVKFHVVNIHTMDELKLTGNCMIGSRPLLNFDNKFNTNPHMRLLKTLLTDAFGTPNGHPKSKPFVDRIMCFFVVKNNIWVRNYQMLDKSDIEKKGDTNTSLIEIGPRMVLIPIRIFSGSLGGATLYQNGAFVSPNDERSMQKKRKGDLYSNRVEHKKLRSEIQVAIQPAPDMMSSKNVFK
jgi:ribosome biogenesis protein BRX1